MAEYIERDMLLKMISHKPSSPTTEREGRLINGFISVVKNCHAADVRPVVRGKWKPRDLTWGRSYYYCSACEETVDMPTEMGIPMFRYCPNCGARMEES